MKPWGGRYCSLTLPPPHTHSRHPHRTHTTPQCLPPPAFSVVRRLSPPPADAAACIPFAFSLILSSPSNHRSRWPSPAFFLSPLPPWRRRLSFPPLSCPYRSVRGKLDENAAGFTSCPHAPFHAWHDVVAWPSNSSDADEGAVWLYLPNTYGRGWRRTHISFDRSVAESSSSQIFCSSVSYRILNSTEVELKIQ